MTCICAVLDYVMIYLFSYAYCFEFELFVSNYPTVILKIEFFQPGSCTFVLLWCFEVTISLLDMLDTYGGGVCLDVLVVGMLR